MAHADASNFNDHREWTKKVLIIVLVGVVFIFFAIAAWLLWTPQPTPITIAIYSDSHNAPIRFQHRLEQLLGQSVQFEDAACILDLETKKGCPTTVASVEMSNTFKALRIKLRVRKLAREEGLDVLVE